MSRFIKVLAAGLIALFAIGSLSACAASQPMDMSSVAAVIDVRTPAEWATGHLDGAINIDVQGADFASAVDALDHTANYVVYCHSGNRAGQAIELMKGAGFTGTLTNGGGVVDAAQLTNMKVVQ
ncbi:rhodanese-like domain-containing protein [Rhodoluna sp.]|uniref:rhodanese-like domain-containing protein n=1 Tax=Rhodoluna sp. TaxID=1969481 RepID=UPI0025EA2851|nr:rhodanese-like domain-containing protein [Rhodoluna sp.]